MTFNLQVQEWVEVALAVHALASVIVAATPTPKDDVILSKFYKLIEIISLTVGKAKQ
jgi:hypothetical protein